MMYFLVLAAALAGPARAGVKVAFTGDQGLGKDPVAVLQLIKAEGADAAIVSGDFDYRDDPDAWDNMITSVLGDRFPFFAALGNHDEGPRAKKYAAKVDARLANVPDAKCAGKTLLEQTCSFRGLFFVFSSVGLNTANLGKADYLAKSLGEDRSLWRVCSWHIPQPEMQVGAKVDQVGWEVYEACREGGAIIATAHEHSYSRTHLMSSFKKKTIASKDQILRLEQGKTLAFVSGLGGHSIRRQVRHDPWWASIYTSNQKASHGALFCDFGDTAPEHATCYFKDIKGRVPDQFELISDLKPQ